MATLLSGNMLLDKCVHDMLNVFAISLFPFVLFAQTSFQSSCTSSDSLLLDAFAKGCVQNWEAASGHPALIARSRTALIASQESIRWRKSFDKCVIHHLQAHVQLKTASAGKVELVFAKSGHAPFQLTIPLSAESAGGWATLYWQGIRLLDSYESLTFRFQGDNNTLQLREVQAITTCPTTLEVSNRAVGEVAATNVNMNQLVSSPEESLHVKASEGIIVGGEVTLTAGSDVLLTIAPCPTENQECIVVPKETKPIVVYNFLSPNGDGQNDTFFIEGLDACSAVELVVLNKLGKVVYHSKSYKNDWDGGSSPKGLYNYQLRCEEGGEVLKGELLLER